MADELLPKQLDILRNDLYLSEDIVQSVRFSGKVKTFLQAHMDVQTKVADLEKKLEQTEGVQLWETVSQQLDIIANLKTSEKRLQTVNDTLLREKKVWFQSASSSENRIDKRAVLQENRIAALKKTLAGMQKQFIEITPLD